MAVSGPDFISLQVTDLEASARFYEKYLGLTRAKSSPPHAVVFDTQPIAFAVRDVLPDVDLDASSRPGQGVGLWLHARDARAIHTALVADDVAIVLDPVDGPFGFTFVFADPDGYHVTLHDRG